MPSIGLNITDFIAVTDMVIRLARLLEETKDSSADYQSLMKELYAFHRALMEVESLVKLSKLPEPVANSLIVMVTNCRDPIGKFLVDIDRYRKSLRAKGSENWAKDVLKKFGWVVLKDVEVRKLRDTLQGLSISIQILLETSGRKTLIELDEKVDEIRSAVVTINAEPNITPPVQWPIPWDQKPICLTDPTGRTFPIPIEACSTYDGFTSLLENSFRGSPLLNLIKTRRFWVFTPISFEKWDLLHKDDWPDFARPGVIVGMSFIDPKPLELEPVGSKNRNSVQSYQEESNNLLLQEGGEQKSLDCKK
ncbi:MAG: hypothetical protein M1813_004173 [Trichoglossum hirsutum]|nr:MAG: hypothetical protein M1813_004173 [Trichoglossum hirsutum]